jgi:hypothetical protein
MPEGRSRRCRPAMKGRHPCRGCSARDYLRKRCHGRHRAIGADLAERSDLRCRGDDPVSADDERCRTHGVQAAGGHPLRPVREVARDPARLHHQQDPQTPPPRSEPGRVGVLDVSQATRSAAHLCHPVRLQEAQAGRCPQTRHGQTQAAAPADRGEAEAAPPAGRRRPAGPGQGPQAPAEAAAAAAGRVARARYMRRPRLPQVPVQGVLAGHGRLPGPARRGWLR